MSLESDIDHAIKAGLPNERKRLKDAWDCLQFANARFEQYPTLVSDAGYQRNGRYRRTAPVMQRIVHTLTANLYRRNPARALASEVATSYLHAFYQRNGMGAKWRRADQLTLISDVAAFQFAGDSDPAAPLKIHLWSSDSLVIWCDPSDPTVAVAVATLDMAGDRRRLRLWTADETRTYLSPVSAGEFSTGTPSAYVLQSAAPNPYRREDGTGILPFAFAHAHPVTDTFWTHGPGHNLRVANDAVNFGLDELADGVRYLAKPIGLAEGVSSSWTPPFEIRPGMFLALPADRSAAGTFNNPSLRYLSPELTFIESTWNDLNNYIDLTLEMHGVPPSTFRMTAPAASGIAIVCENGPILDWAEQRRQPFSHFEQEAAVIACAVGASHLRDVDPASARELEYASIEPGFSIRWGPLYFQLPGPDRDAADTFRLDTGLASVIDLLEEREDLTREQAEGRAVQVQTDNAFLAALGAPTEPPQAAADASIASA